VRLWGEGCAVDSREDNDTVTSGEAFVAGYGEIPHAAALAFLDSLVITWPGDLIFLARSSDLRNLRQGARVLRRPGLACFGSGGVVVCVGC